ncbi:hypothetical protein EVAR_46027_1 [Eumeta japonica]|uniref:Uncharacterized protein n=1 Tax=Eumeta variegata TaxID=151549 RepID=A0A4C1Z6V7_EUMVA|nr:hypothetical protein EVAR_46027_1 [Eumeta japonica]
MWNSSTKNGTDLRLGVRALLIIARLTANEKTVQRWSPRMWNSSTKNGLETWRTGAANHRSTDRERENGAAALVSAELFDEERHETWRTGAANHRSTDRERENGAAAGLRACGTLRRRQHRRELGVQALNHRSTDREREVAAALVSAWNSSTKNS